MCDEENIRAREWSHFILEQTLQVRATTEFAVFWTAVELLLTRMGVEGVRAMSDDYENTQNFKSILSKVKADVASCFVKPLSLAGSLRSLRRADAVRILTIHKCKGLEFHSVIVQGVETETFFGSQNAADCAYFVAISRAKERLVLTTTKLREKLQGANPYWRENRSTHERYLSYVYPEIGGHC
jgi:superfamily I DNA/RNA helicase